MDHDVGAIVDRAHQVRRGKGRVHGQGHPGIVGHVGHRSHVEHLDARVAERLGEHEAGLGSYGLGERPWVPGIDERGGDAEAGHSQVQHVVAAAIDVAAGHDVVAGVQDGRHGQVQCSLAAGRAHGSHAAFQRGQPLLEDCHRRV